MARDRLTMHPSLGPITEEALTRMIDAALGANPKAAPPADLTLEQVKLAVAARERIREQTGPGGAA